MKKMVFLCFALFSAAVASAQTLKIMSYNIHHGADKAEVNTLDSIAAFIKNSGADLIGLQEIDSVCKRSGNVDQMKRLGELTGFHYAFVRHLAYDGGAYGQGILSRYPISEIKNHRITLLKKDGPKDSRALLSVLVALPNKKKLVFASVHFALDVESRLIQSDETINYLQNKKWPVILTGDLNAEPTTQEVLNLQRYFAATDPKSLMTYPERGPKKKIDYVFVSKDFFGSASDVNTYPTNFLSDHLPLACRVTLKWK
ncbi:MAG: endonuclease/exonuclease/phosphatase family protein [Pedobacter sp.]|nr:endonuclease/exonuclease/phosphatase family protein [Pedobacter sp.]MDQ8051572.1 endonuclease/exonuclease/phosphatase family protein [Pedobacter sp.]